MKVKQVIRNMRAKLLASYSKRKRKKVFKYAKKMHNESVDAYYYKDYIKTESVLTNGFAKSFKHKYKGLFDKKGNKSKYLDHTNPTDILIQNLGDKYYQNENKKEKLYNKIIPARRKFFNTKEQKKIAKLRKQLIVNKEAVHKIAFEPRPENIETINGRDALVVVLEGIGCEE